MTYMHQIHIWDYHKAILLGHPARYSQDSTSLKRTTHEDNGTETQWPRHQSISHMAKR